MTRLFVVLPAGRRPWALVALVAALALGVAGCHRKPKRTRAPAPPPPITGEVQPETGLASWYGKPYDGRPTANGEIYDMNAFTAAHRTLPFNTWVRVTNLENNLTTTVRINDRGPFIEGRIIDLSHAAAEAIAMLGPGTALVRLDVLQGPGGPPAAAGTPIPGGHFTVQVGAFSVQANALDLQGRLTRNYHDVFIQRYDSPRGIFYRVRVGRVGSYAEAVSLAQQLRGEPEISSTFIVRLD